ncbi:hypothetical protein CC117_09025 [Parafrankia colletiae]|uniref:Uncharacterized protein n=1 Tax=Parafrankia colletiae TaxID=573497 RepID=A0A1S1RJE5_9ACTN|nr:hypothetical protein CC117_09025 [Parafrankia colletiae]
MRPEPLDGAADPTATGPEGSGRGKPDGRARPAASGQPAGQRGPATGRGGPAAGQQRPAARPRRAAAGQRRPVSGDHRVSRWVSAHPIAFALIGAAMLLVGSALVGALDLFAVGAVLGFWTLIVATGLVLGRPGIDWAVPTDELRRAARQAFADYRREASGALRRLARTGGASLPRGSRSAPTTATAPTPAPSDGPAERANR